MRSLRLRPELDELIQRAAAKSGVTVSEFVRRAAEREAEQVLQGVPRPELSDEWKTWLRGKGPYAAEWVQALEGLIGVVEGDDEAEQANDWARSIRERNWRS